MELKCPEKSCIFVHFIEKDSCGKWHFWTNAIKGTTLNVSAHKYPSQVMRDTRCQADTLDLSDMKNTFGASPCTSNRVCNRVALSFSLLSKACSRAVEDLVEVEIFDLSNTRAKHFLWSTLYTL